MTRITAVHGTWADQSNSRWFHYGSPWWTYMAAHGASPLDPERGFLWSGDLNGHDWWRRWFAWLPWVTNNFERRFSDWIAAGEWAEWYLGRFPLRERNVIVHSHGLQPILLAVPTVPIRTLISVGSPNRNDIADYLFEKNGAPPSKNIGYWIHVCDADRDKTGVSRYRLGGQIGDGAFSLSRIQSMAHLNIQVPKIGHSGLFNDPTKYHLWEELGLLAMLREDPHALQKDGPKPVPVAEREALYRKAGAVVLRHGGI